MVRNLRLACTCFGLSSIFILSEDQTNSHFHDSDNIHLFTSLSSTQRIYRVSQFTELTLKVAVPYQNVLISLILLTPRNSKKLLIEYSPYRVRNKDAQYLHILAV